METLEATIFFVETPSQPNSEVLKQVQSMGGRLIKSIGTAHLVIFSDAEAAMRAALQLKRSDSNLAFRIGIDRGSITLTHTDALGESVNLAARLQGIAKPQEVLFSKNVHTVIENDLFPIKDVGPRQFKGIDHTIHVFSLEKSKSEAITKPKEVAPAKEFKSQEVFDFSRVDHERIQEQEALRRQLPEDIHLKSQVIPLAENIVKSSPTKSNPEALLVIPPPVEIRPPLLPKILAVLVLVTLVGLGSHFLSSKSSSTPPAPLSPKAKSDTPPATELMQTIQNRKVAKVPTFGSLRVEVDPPGAQVYFNEQLVSSHPPVKIKNVPSKAPITIKVSKFGYQESFQIINLLPQEDKIIKFKLKKK